MENINLRGEEVIQDTKSGGYTKVSTDELVSFRVVYYRGLKHYTGIRGLQVSAQRNPIMSWGSQWPSSQKLNKTQWFISC